GADGMNGWPKCASHSPWSAPGTSTCLFRERHRPGSTNREEPAGTEMTDPGPGSVPRGPGGPHSTGGNRGGDTAERLRLTAGGTRGRARLRGRDRQDPISGAGTASASPGPADHGRAGVTQRHHNYRREVSPESVAQVRRRDQPQRFAVETLLARAGGA